METPLRRSTMRRATGWRSDAMLFLMALAAAGTFSCTVTRVHDGDGPLWCASGIKVRIAGVQAPDFKSAAPCHRPDARRGNYICDDAAATRSQQVVERIVLHQTMRCQPMGTSYKRVVARCTLGDGRSLSCTVIAAGAAVRWERYWRRYRMGGCR
jgi:endonuclease YncB( thermonuclease family)